MDGIGDSRVFEHAKKILGFLAQLPHLGAKVILSCIFIHFGMHFTPNEHIWDKKSVFYCFLF